MTYRRRNPTPLRRRAFDERERAMLIAAFWTQVRLGLSGTLCWEWQGIIGKNGYGHVNFRRQRMLAHRVSYEDQIGPIPPGLLLRHTCDNRRCVNPHHLIPGTHLDNAQDAVSRGRNTRGETSAFAILSEDQVREIRAHPRGKGYQQALAARFGCTQGNISAIVLRKSWAHISDQPSPERCPLPPLNPPEDPRSEPQG